MLQEKLQMMCFDTHWSNALIFPNQTLWRCYAAEKPDGCAATWKMYVLTPEAIAMAESDNSSPNIRKLNLSVITQLEFRANVVVRFIFRMLPSRRWVFPFKTTQEPLNVKQNSGTVGLDTTMAILPTSPLVFFFFSISSKRFSLSFQQLHPGAV